jgi:hypothetical protein
MLAPSPPAKDKGKNVIAIEMRSGILSDRDHFHQSRIVKIVPELTIDRRLTFCQFGLARIQGLIKTVRGRCELIEGSAIHGHRNISLRIDAVAVEQDAVAATPGWAFSSSVNLNKH